MDSWIAWFLLVFLVAYGFVAFVKAVIEEDERRRNENEQAWLEYEAGLRGGI